MSDSWIIEKLMFWQASAWVKYDNKPKLFLRMHGDQLLITVDKKIILETFNMQCKMKGIYKGDILILILSDSSQHIRKLKFQIKSNATLCYQRLGEHFPVIQHNSNNYESINVRYRNYKDVLKTALESKDSPRQETNMDMPNFVKLCLLDPTFPRLVHTTKNILEADELL